MFDRLLEDAENDLTPERALRILEESRLPENAHKLFQAASALRDKHIGRELWWTGAINRILPCKLRPMCRYCGYSNFEPPSIESLVKAVNALEALGIRHMHLSGGTNPNGYDEEILAMVKAMRAASSVAIEVNLGPSLQRETVRELKKLGVTCITSSLETMNEDIFRMTKPGDSLEKRKALLEMCEEEGMPVRGMMLVGLGESYADRIRHLFYLKSLSGVRHLRFSRYMPRPASPLDLPRCSPWEVVRTLAVARMIMPHVQLGLADGNTNDDLPLWFMAGGGNQLIGASVSQQRADRLDKRDGVMIADDMMLSNNMLAKKRYLNEMGLNIGFECPPGA